MAAEKIIPFAAFEERMRAQVSTQDTVARDQEVVDLREVRIARALDAVSGSSFFEQKAPPVSVEPEVAEYRRRIRAGGYAVDAEELAASILDSLLPSK